MLKVLKEAIQFRDVLTRIGSSHPQQVAISSLPADVYQIIFRLLPMRHQFSIRRVCRLWKHVIDHRVKFPQFLFANKLELLPPASDEDAHHKVVGLYCEKEDSPNEFVLNKRDEHGSFMLRMTASGEVRPIMKVDHPVCRTTQKGYNTLIIYESAARHGVYTVDIRTSTLSLFDPHQPDSIEFFQQHGDLSVSGTVANGFVLKDARTNDSCSLVFSDRPTIRSLEYCYRFNNRLVVVLQTYERSTDMMNIFDLNEFFAKRTTTLRCVTDLRAACLRVHFGTAFVSYFNLGDTTLKLINVETGKQSHLDGYNTRSPLSTPIMLVWKEFLFYVEPREYQLRIHDLEASQPWSDRVFRLPLLTPDGILSIDYMCFDGDILAISSEQLRSPMRLRFVVPNNKK